MNPNKFNRLLRKIKYSKKSADLIYKEYYPKVVFHLSRKFGALIDCKEFAHITFLSLFDLETLPDYVEAPLAWINLIAERKAIDRLKSQRVEVEIPYNFSVSFDIERLVEKEDLRKCMKELDETTQRILFMHYWEGYSLKEVSEILEVNYDTVRQKESRSYKKIKTCMSQKSFSYRLKK